MPRKKTPSDRFSELTWNDIEAWAGDTVVSRGTNYQRQGRVADLAVMADGSLIAWVDGSKRYATRVAMDEDDLPESICTCPYEMDCKHGVAVLLEYLKRLENNRAVPQAKQDDERLKLLADEDREDEPLVAEKAGSADAHQEIDAFLQGKTKAQLIDLIQELAGQHLEVARELSDRKQLISGNIETLVTRLSQEIRHLGSEPGWRRHWDDEGYTPDYSGIRRNLENLLNAGHPDEVLTLGLELVTTGTRQVEESHDEGETAIEIADCMPVIVEALERSSLVPADKLTWALEAVLEDQFNLCDAFAEYLFREHPQSAWYTQADRLLARLHDLNEKTGAADFSRNYQRDRLSDWAIHALEEAGRQDEVIPLCIAEAKLTGSFERLVERLVAVRRFEEAEKWIKEGIRDTGKKWPGIAAGLRKKMREMRTLEQNWPVVAALQVEAFVRQPSSQAFTECRQACDQTKVWPQVRESLLHYLEKGEFPWQQEGWPLPKSGLDRPEADKRDRFPLFNDLINIAIHEKKPNQVLKWYDQRPKGAFGPLGVDEDAIAAAVQNHTPERAVAIWKTKAEGLIALVKPNAYQAAARYLRKAGEVMSRQNNQAEWDQYLNSLRQTHARKPRLLEILAALEEKPIMKKSR
jgi:uncharacterized Zn finger protein